MNPAKGPSPPAAPFLLRRRGKGEVMTLEELLALQDEDSAKEVSAARDGLKVLERHPDWASAHLQATQEMQSIYLPLRDRLPNRPSPQMLECALTHIDIWARAYLNLVSSQEQQQAFAAILLASAQTAWRLYKVWGP